MTLEEFVEKVQDELQETPAELITADTNYKELEEWGSLASLSLICFLTTSLLETNCCSSCNHRGDILNEIMTWLHSL